MRRADPFRVRRSVAIGAMLLVALGLAVCGGNGHAGPPPRAESAYPVAPFARIETGMHVAPVTRMDVDAAERFLVSGSDDKTVRVWDLATGALRQTLRVPIDEGNVGKIFAVALSPDGSTVAAGGFTGHFVFLFDRESGALRRRIGSFEGSINHLAFSRDGRRLAAMLGGNSGLRVYDTASWTEMFADRDYGDSSYSADFAADGRLVTTSNDGFLRLYGRDLKLLRKEKAPGGEQPFFARFSPDGTRIAVGYADTTHVDILAADGLRLLHQADTQTAANGNLSKVAWSADGRFLYAGGRYDDDSGRNLVRRWADGGRGGVTEFAVSTNTIFDLKPLRDGRLAVGAGDPLVTVLDANSRAVWQKTGEIADFRNQIGERSFKISADGQVIRFGFDVWVERPAEFSFRDARLVLDPPADPALKGAVTKIAAFAVTDWENKSHPKLNGTPLPLEAYEGSRSLAIAPAGDRFLLGTEWSLRLFDANGREIWNVAAPSAAWGVNISGDGRFALGAFGDGTIRWYDLRDGRELLAFFPHKDGKRWVAWMPEGFFAASEGGEQLLGYHLNRGAEQTPEFISVDQLYVVFYRPDLLLARLQGDEATVQKARVAIGDINQVLAAGLPPGVMLAGPTQVTIDRGTFVHELLLTDRGGGIGRIEYRVDGVLQANVAARPAELDRPGADGRIRRTRPLDLPPGQHEVRAMAYNADGRVASPPVTQVVEVDDPLARPPALYGLAVGIDEYSDSALRLKYAAADAQAVVRALQTQGRALFTRVDLRILPNAEARRGRIEGVFTELAQLVQPNDVFVLYLSGHGVVIDGTYYFVPQDVLYENQAALRAGSLSQGRLTDLLAAIKAKKSLIILDTCFAGAFRPEQQVAFSFRGLEEKTAIDRLMQATGRTMFASSTAAQHALEGYDGHGVFTYALLQGLRGTADERGNRNGQIEIDELFDHVRQTVPQLTFHRWKIKQVPMRDVVGDNFPIGLRN